MERKFNKWMWGLIGYFFLTVLAGTVWIGYKVFQKITHKMQRAEHAEKLKEFNQLLSFDSGVIGKPFVPKKYNWNVITDVRAVQNDIRKDFSAILGNKLPYEENPTISIKSSQELEDGITRIIFTVPAEPGYVIKGCMLVPESQKPLPTILLAYGLGGTLFQTCGWGMQSYHHDMGMGMAKQGIIAVNYVLRGLGQDGKDWGRSEWGPMDYRDFVGYTLQYGSNAMNVWVYDTLQVFHGVQAHSNIDRKNIFLGGISHGGQIALYAGALASHKIQGVIAMGAFVSYESLFTEIHNWTGHAIPNIMSVGNMGDVAALIAPRPLLIQWGEQDSTAPWAQLRPSSLNEFDRVEKVYTLLKSRHNIKKVITKKRGHEFESHVAGRFILDHLNMEQSKN